MKLVIAETGEPPEELGGAWPDYPEMFARMLERAGGGFDVEAVDVRAGRKVPPPDPDGALLVTGSPSGVYEDLPYLPALGEAVRAWARAMRPVVGICFGHQVVAHAFGAKVAKSDHGWGVGVHTYEVVAETPWGEGPPRFACAVSHQDQVLSLPAGFRRVAGSAFCPLGTLVHETLPVLTFQPHPEFSHPYASALMALRSDRIPEERVALGQASLKNPSDREAIGVWIRRFLEGERRDLS